MIRSAVHRAFTLVEVMLATVILGLGVLGLAALFAGVARQQLVASRQSESVGRTQNAMAMTIERFGRYDTAQFTEAGSASQSNALPLFAWFPLTASDNRVAGRPVATLTSNPYLPNTPTGTLNPRYFEIDAPADALYFDPSNANAIPNNTITIANAEIQPIGLAEPLIVPRRRIVADSVEIVIQWAEVAAPGNVTSSVLSYTDSQEFQSQPQAIDSWPQLTFNGMVGSPPVQVGNLVFDLARQPDVTSSGALASGTITLPMGSFLRRIELRPYSFQEDTVLSLNDRLAYEDDPNYPGGRRPYMGMTALIRATGTGASQVTMMTYAIEPTSNGAEFVPPERYSDYQTNDAILREVRMTMGFDQNRQQYYVEPLGDGMDFTAEEMRWAIQPGQLILVRGDEMAAPDDPESVNILSRGSDIPVRVVNLVTNPAGAPAPYRGYIDDSPRSSGRSLLPNRTTTVTVSAWVMFPTAQSLLDDSVWRITPIEARQFQVR